MKKPELRSKYLKELLDRKEGWSIQTRFWNYFDQDGQLDPDPSDVLRGKIEYLNKKCGAYTLLLLPSLIGITVSFLLLVVIVTLGMWELEIIIYVLLLLSILWGILVVSFSLISLVIFTYGYIREDIEIRPINGAEDRLAVSQGSDEKYGVQVDNAKSFGMIIFMTFIPGVWVFLIDSVLLPLTNHQYISYLSSKIEADGFSNTVVPVVNFFIPQDLSSVLITLTPSDYILLAKYIPAVVLLYIGFQHLRFLAEKWMTVENNGGHKVSSEASGFLAYAYFSIIQIGKSTEFSDIKDTGSYLLITVCGTIVIIFFTLELIIPSF